ncbi:hypothetical protein H7347_03745 [Corynebacterium sp. zg-331]|uniref:DUF3800 domain-containing protein n=1 Tax=unclassified Corynebacterium TaxID=2624378 RepID=UPI00128B074F|nr:MULTISPECIES: DUF3800 domain-containing protein [unclassified Corynebacterium]MBC3185693.1 hypothetical protein [Corynebacterium sp. zg-331]MPV52186.1 hypothetical protein [Corynebacterium sp. zg331]
MSRLQHPSLVRMYGQGADDEDCFLYLDESYSIPDAYKDGAFYILSAAQVRHADLAGTRRELQKIVGGGWWHTTDALRSTQGRTKTKKLLEQINAWADPYFITIATPLDERFDSENARRDCLRALISYVYSPAVSTTPRGIVFEARHHQKENNRDRRLVRLLREEGIMPADVHVAWVSPAEECLLWLADLTCMAYRRQLTHQDDTSRYFATYLEAHVHVIEVPPSKGPPFVA